MTDEDKVIELFQAGHFELAYKLIEGQKLVVPYCDFKLIDTIKKLGNTGQQFRQIDIPTISSDILINVSLSIPKKLTKISSLHITSSKKIEHEIAARLRKSLGLGKSLQFNLLADIDRYQICITSPLWDFENVDKYINPETILEFIFNN